MKIKKIILSLLLISATTFAFGCKKSPALFDNVSRLRSDVFYGETENYAVTVYPELRESPMIANGEISEIKNLVIIKLRVKNNLTGEFTVTFEVDKKYSETFSFSAFSDCYVSSVEVEKLPDKPFIATICHEEALENVTLESKLNDDTISYKTALDKAYKSKTEYIDERSVNGVFGGEIYLRLIAEKDKNYWYVGFITDEETLALLLDDKGVLLEERILPNPA